MPRLAPLDWREVERVFVSDGWIFKRERGDHRAYVKPGFNRPVIIPRYSAVGIDIIHNNMRTAGMSRERFFELLGR